MANRFKKMLAPILKEECNKAFQRGFEEGKQAGWDERILAYENEIEFLKTIISGLTKEENIMENTTTTTPKGKMIPRGDKIRAMGDDELAWVLQEFRVDAYGKGRGDHKGYLPDSKKLICDWLKELVEA